MTVLFIDVVGCHHPLSAATGTPQANQVARCGPKTQTQNHKYRKVHAIPRLGQMSSKPVNKQGSDGCKDNAEPNSPPENPSNLCQRFDRRGWQWVNKRLGARRFRGFPWSQSFPMSLQLLDGVTRRKAAH
jgi:hypothetical protein